MYIYEPINNIISQMKANNVFRGLGIALITPFKSDGKVDFPALQAIVENQIGNGIDFLCILGTTAETPCLSDSEKNEIIKTVVEVNNKRVPILLGCGSNNTATVAEYLQTTDFTGIDGVLLVCPYYNKPTQDGIYQHFKTLDKVSPLPIVLYNIPGRTGVNISASTVLRLASECEKIVAIKEASGNITQIDEILQHAPEGFEVLSGDDAITFELLSAGAVGVISVIGNAYPYEFNEMVKNIQRGDIEKARIIHRHFNELYQLLSVDGNPAGIKCLMSLLNKCENKLRLPLVPVREVTRQQMIEWTKEA